MSVIESSGLMKSKDTNGNTNIIYPITTKENVAGLEEFDAHLLDTNNPHEITPEQINAAKNDLSNVTDAARTNLDVYSKSEVDSALANVGGDGGTPTVTATSIDGVTYTATVDDMDSLVVGKKIIIIPDFTSTVVNPTLNVNGLGDKYLRCPLTTNNSATTTGASTSWIIKTKPLEVMWNGTYWVSNLFRPDANTLYGTVSIANGGTGGVTAEAARTNLDVYSKAEVDAAIQTAWADVVTAEEARF